MPKTGEATSSFLWAVVRGDLVVLKIAFCKMRAASIFRVGQQGRGCVTPVLPTECKQALLIVLAGR